MCVVILLFIDGMIKAAQSREMWKNLARFTDEVLA